jgi:hypothetical protein
MARVTAVKVAKKSPGSCRKCGKEIPAGAPYIWWSFRYGGKRVRCCACPRPRPSDLTNNDKLSRCYAAGEAIDDAVAKFLNDFDADGLRSSMEEAASDVREVADEYRESAENIESGFNGNRVPLCDEMEEKADNLDSKADEIESAASDIEDFDEDRAKEEAEEEAGEEVAEGQKDDTAIATRAEEILKDKKDEWAQEQASKAEEFTDISPEG